MSNLIEILKGGSGSGDFGHTGRAGKRGGSGGGGGKGRPRKGRRSREVLDKEIAERKKPKKPSLKDAKLTRVEDFNYTPGAFDSFIAKTEDGSTVIVKREDDMTRGREAGAFEIAQAIGYDAVPETVSRHIDGKLHSVQEWVSEPTAYERQRMRSGLHFTEKDFKRQAVFDMVIGNDDRTLNNYLVGDDNRIISIDNGLAGARYLNKKWIRDPGSMISKVINENSDVFEKVLKKEMTFKKSDFDFILNNNVKIRELMEKMNNNSAPGWEFRMNQFNSMMDHLPEFVNGLG